MRRSNRLPGYATFSLVALIFTGLFFSLAGCGKKKEAQEVALPFSGQKIRIAVPANGDFETAWDVLIREWEAQNEATVEIVEVQLDPSKATSENIAAAYKSVEPTISFFPIQHLSNFVTAGLCTPLPTEELEQSKFNWYDIFPGLRDQILSLEGKPAAIVTSCPTLKLYYRKDLLDAANLEVPKTWEEYDQLAISVEKWAPGLKIAEPGSKEYALPLFFSRAFPLAKHPGNYSLFFDVYSGEPLIDSPAFAEALRRFSEHRNESNLIADGLSPTDCLKEMLEGRAAFAIASEYLSAGHQFERAEGIDVGCAQLPGSLRVFNSSTDSWEDLPEDEVNRVPVTAFDGFCATVSKEANETQTLAALNLARRLSMPAPAYGFDQGRRSLCRSSWFSLAETWSTDQLTGNEKLESLDATSFTLSNAQVQACYPFHDADRYFQILEESLQKDLQENSEPTAVLKTVREEWEQLSGKDRESLINSYRLRLGLRPTTLP